MDFLDLTMDKLAVSPWPAQPNISILRADAIHPVVSGNKLFKLLPYIHKTKTQKFNGIISVGGRFSNHLHAVAFLGDQLKIPTVGLVQGYVQQPTTQTLKDCMSWGMDIQFLDKTSFRQRYEQSFWHRYKNIYPNYQQVWEGGWSQESIDAGHLWWQSIIMSTDMVICPIGSGGTYASLVKFAPAGISVVGVPAFKDPDQYSKLIDKLGSVGISRSDIQLWVPENDRGFGKLNEHQVNFKKDFEADSGISLDLVYNAKSFCELADRLKTSDSLKNKKIVILHTGGLQGDRR